MHIHTQLPFYYLSMLKVMCLSTVHAAEVTQGCYIALLKENIMLPAFPHNPFPIAIIAY